MAATFGGRGGGALAELARKPPGYKVAVFAGIGAVLGLIYWQFLLGPLRKERNGLEVKFSELQTESKKLDRELVEYERLRERSDQLARTIQANQKALPTGSELPAFFETLNRKVGEAGVEVKKWEYKKEVPVETFIKVPLEIELTGSFNQMKRFFASLVQRGVAGGNGEVDRERIITIENLTLSVPRQKSRELLLTAKFTASTFRQEDTSAPADDAKAPPSRTPAGALKRSETRAAPAGDTPTPSDGTTPPRDR